MLLPGKGGGGLRLRGSAEPKTAAIATMGDGSTSWPVLSSLAVPAGTVSGTFSAPCCCCRCGGGGAAAAAAAARFVGAPSTSLAPGTGAGGWGRALLFTSHIARTISTNTVHVSFAHLHSWAAGERARKGGEETSCRRLMVRSDFSRCTDLEADTQTLAYVMANTNITNSFAWETIIQVSIPQGSNEFFLLTEINTSGLDQRI